MRSQACSDLLYERVCKVGGALGSGDVCGRAVRAQGLNNAVVYQLASAGQPPATLHHAQQPTPCLRPSVPVATAVLSTATPLAGSRHDAGQCPLLEREENGKVF